MPVRCYPAAPPGHCRSVCNRVPRTLRGGNRQ
jgi:hypothetical protein